MTEQFKDHFSTQSDDYARYRPTYPNELFQYLASISNKDSAWDCATGSGQVAVALTEHFTTIIATDASAAQIAKAHPHPQVTYQVALAENSGLKDSSVDLITVGQALHWFEQTAFFREAARVLRPNGVLAVWCYETCEVEAACDAVIERLYSGIVGEFWPAERVLIESGYDDVELPGKLLSPPEFAMELEWTADDMLGYLRTWSACERYAAANRSDPVLQVEAALIEAWGDSIRPVSWPLKLKVSRLNSLLE